MNPNTLKLVQEAAALMALVVELSNLAIAAFNRVQAVSAGDEVTDNDLETLRTGREAALDRLAKQLV